MCAYTHRGCANQQRVSTTFLTPKNSQLFCQQAQHAKLCSDLLQAQKAAGFDSPLAPATSGDLHFCIRSTLQRVTKLRDGVNQHKKKKKKQQAQLSGDFYSRMADSLHSTARILLRSSFQAELFLNSSLLPFSAAVCDFPLHSCPLAEFVIPNGGGFGRGACPLKLKKMAHMHRNGKRIVACSMQNQKKQHECRLRQADILSSTEQGGLKKKKKSRIFIIRKFVF